MYNYLQNSLSKIRQALFKTRSVLLEQPHRQVDSLVEVNNEFCNDLLEKLVKADVGVKFSKEIVSKLKGEIGHEKISKDNFKLKLKSVIKSQIKLSSSQLSSLTSHLNVYLIIGVNGTGKTTMIGKLARRFKETGLNVLIVAADTFRAAASDQLFIWANKAGVEIYAPKEIKKPDAVVFNAIEKAKKGNYNILLIDTAGRLHSQTNLIDELKKIDTVINKNTKEVNHKLPIQYEKLIVLDATIGQNAIAQVELFSKAIGLTGIALAKLDSSSKGGVILNILNKFSLPVQAIGTGEKIDDIADFNLDEYLDGLLM